MTGWQLCRFKAQCAMCGHWAERVWRHFINQSTSNMSVCETCADALTQEES